MENRPQSQPTDSGNLKRAVQFLAREGALDILLFVDRRRTARYKELNEVVKSQTTLNRRLDELTSLGILRRKTLSEKYRPTEYSLTNSGREVLERVKRLNDLLRNVKSLNDVPGA